MKVCDIWAPPISGVASPNVHSYVSAPLAPVTVAVNACASPTTDGPACVSFTVSARAGAAASMVPASTAQEATARIWLV